MSNDVIELAYQRAEEANEAGKLDEAAMLTDIGRAWYLVGKCRLGVALDADEQIEWKNIMARLSQNPEQQTRKDGG